METAWPRLWEGAFALWAFDLLRFCPMHSGVPFKRGCCSRGWGGGVPWPALQSVPVLVEVLVLVRVLALVLAHAWVVIGMTGYNQGINPTFGSMRSLLTSFMLSMLTRMQRWS